MSGLFEYPRAAGTASHLLEGRVNNFAFKFKGSESGNDYNSEFNIANFPNLVKFVGKYNDEAIQPIVKKAEGQETLVRLQKIINTVDQYGPSALSALNDNEKEQDQSNFLMKFKRGNSLSSLQINNIEWSQILMDERIQTFLKNLMPLNEPKAN